MRRLFCAVWFVVGWFVPAATADGGALGQLRAADTVRLVVDQSFVYTARTDYRKKVIRGFQMPFAEVARDLLEGAGARVVGPDTEGAGPAGATVTVTARGRAIDRLYIDDVTGYLFTGAEIIGEIVVDAPGAVKRLSILTPDRRAKLTPLSGTAEVVPVVNRGDPRGSA